MKTAELLSRLRELHVRLWSENGELKISAPKAALTPELKAELAQHKAALLELLAPAADPAREPIRPRPRAGPLPLSFTQQRLWFLDQLEPGLLTYNMWLALRLDGELEAGALERGVAEVVRRHEILRTTFRTEGGVPTQVIAPPGTFVLERLRDEAERDPAAWRAEVQRWLRAEIRRPYDLERGPLFRCVLVRIGPREHVLCAFVHHILFDGLSKAVFVRELVELYEAALEERPARLPELPIQYADYAVWQREFLAGPEGERQMAYWRTVLGETLPVLEFPADRARPAVQTYAGSYEKVEIPAPLVEALAALAVREGTTLFNALLAVFQVFLCRSCNQEDLIVGTAIANRTRAEVQDLLGFFVNTLVLRTHLGGAPSFRQVLGRVRDGFVAALDHQDTPFEKLVDAFAPERDLSITPIFQAFFVFDEDTGESRRMGRFELREYPLSLPVTRTDLVLSALKDRDGFHAGFEYATDLFDPPTIRRMLDQLVRLLEGLVAHPDRSILEAELVPDRERRRILDWGTSAFVAPSAATTHELVTRRAQRNPAALALVYPGASGDERLTYGELESRSNRLARRLIALGATPGSLVGLCVERSLEMVVAQLAILKTGAAYVPLDPAFPKDRLAYMVEDAKLGLIVTERRQEQLLPQGARRLFLDEERERIAKLDAGPVGVRVSGGSRMYVIYTSGSTGRPKGVEIEHRSAVNFLASMSREPGLKEGETCLALTTLSFDIAVLELFLPLVNGGTVVIAPREVTGDGEKLAELLARSKPDVMQATPATWRMLLLAGWKGDGRLRMLCGGEALTRDLAESLLDRGAELWNLYGPTETTVWSTLKKIERNAPITIGRPIASTRVYVLDGRGEPTPIGVPGELWIGGAGLARGYLERLELTAERFVADPFSREAGARMYRTGDLARWSAEGELECLGRTDHQVKVRGYRIELGEIESVLQEDEGVHLAAAVVREDVPGDKRIVAYFARKPGSSTSAEELSSRAEKRLPSYMVPAHVVELASLPLTPNGKVDRRALYAQGPVEARARAEYVAPRDEIERGIAEIWAAVLGVERVGVQDDFFELGGNSLLTTQAMARVRDAYGVSIALRELFQEPTVEALSRKVREASPERESRIERVDRGGPLSLSFAQERLWFLDQLEPGQSTYNMWIARTLRGRLDEAALERALAEIVRRHEVLRTHFVDEGGTPRQAIDAGMELVLERIDPPQPADAASRRRWLREQLLARSREPFDLARGPLFRASLGRVSEEEHVLFVLTHHTVFDGLSMAVFLRELATLYEAYAAGKDSPLPELAVQYADYAAWQRSRLSGAEGERELAWWKEQLAGELPVLELPTDRKRPALQTFHGAIERGFVPRERIEALTALGNREGATLFMVLLAAYDVLLARLSGQSDVIVGTAVGNRERTELEGLLGFFANTLALRTDLSGDPTFRVLVARVRESVLGALDHQDTPFEKLVDELAPKRSLSTPPIFQTLFVLDEDLGYAGRMGPVGVEYFDLDLHVARMDLTFWVYQGRDGLVLWAEYNTDLFAGATVARFLRSFETLLQGIVADADRIVADLPLIGAHERHRLLETWNRAPTVDVPAGTVHDQVTRRAQRNPAALALVYPGASGDERLTYGELESRSNRLARRLIALGATPGSLVGLCVERSLEMVVAQLAILKTGAAYVPLDPAFPKDRLAYMVEDAKLGLIVTERRQEQLLPQGARRLFLDEERERIAKLDAGPVGVRVSGGSRMYVIYTSGSTGRPKGVEIEHRSAVNFLASMSREPGLKEGETCLALTTLSFDIAVLELFLPLVNGGTVVIAPREVTGDGEKLAELLARSKPEVMQATPATWRMLLLAGWKGDGRLRMLCGGEALTRDLAESLLDRGSELWNLYGPTETTVWSTLKKVERGSPITIGRPIASTRVYVLDGRGEPTPIGVPGELWIGGAGLARGYLERPELTAERFVADPFSREAGARMYRTGDLARWSAEGELECLGRTDHQVKVRGYRIELGEIESVLQEDEGVHLAAAVVREDVPGDKRIVAYFARKPGSSTSAEELSSRAEKRLPSYMVPAHVVELAALPLTPNGKVDRRALYAQGPVEARARAEYVAPRDEIERGIAEIWAAVLGVERVGVQDDFFELGGNSLLTTQAMARVRDAYGVSIALRELFQEPTVEALSRKVREASPERESRIERVDRGGPLSLSFAQERLWFLDQLEPGQSTYNMWIARTLRGRLDESALERALAEIVRRHEVLRTHFVDEGGTPRQAIDASGAPRLERVEVAGKSPDERRQRVRERLLARSREPFDLARGPLFRASLGRVSEEEHVLFVLTHHTVFDGLSMGVFLRELAALYEAYAAGKDSPLPELAVQYADYAAWQRSRLSGAEGERELAWWKEQLAGELPVLELPTDRKRPALQTFHGAIERGFVPRERIEALTALGNREGATLFMVLLAAYDLLLARLSGQQEVIVGTAVGNRERTELEGLLGFFANTLALRTDLSGDPTFRVLVARVREAVLGALDHQDTPFEKLVDELAPKRSLSTPPIFQTLFVLDEDLGYAGRMGPVGVEYFDLDLHVARMDLTFWVYQGRDGLVLWAEYNTDLFERETVARFLGCFTTLLGEIVAAPERTLGRLALLTGEERRTLLEAWNRTLPAETRAASHVVELVARQASRSPDAPALVVPGASGDETLSYAELESRSNRLARRLIALGATPGSLVGLCVERSLEMVVAQLAILKTGAAYVPLDPAFPKERLAYMAEDARLALVVTQRALEELLPAGARRLFLDEERAELAQLDPRPVGIHVAGTARMYVIYTSGSTGRPKGVEIEHRTVVNFLGSMAREPGMRAGERCLALTTLSFDIAVLELFLPLTTGGTVVIAPREATGDGEKLAGLLARLEPEVMQATPATWRMLLLAGWKGDGRLRMLCGGEALTRELADSLLDRGSELWNLYGPTETTVWSTLKKIERGSPITIGRPIASTRVYVLDARGEPTPIGVPGELWIGGAGLARGYLERPELTAERFVADPFSREAGARMYRTGDLARWIAPAASAAGARQGPAAPTSAALPGELECLGRTDHQVKVRGYRIELGEIESVLQEDPAVHMCAVIVREDVPGDRRIVAYCVAKEGAALSPLELREASSRRLPGYMVPAHVVVLDALPLTPNGKVDRRALYAQGPVEARARAEYVAPRDEVERGIAEIWAAVLGVERVGVQDDFFELGGNSLLTTQAMARVRDAYGVSIALRELFQEPTLEALARKVRSAAPESGGALERASREGPLPLSFAQERLWFLDQLEPGQSTYNMWIARTLRGRLDEAALERALAEIVRRHEVLRTHFVDEGGTPRQAIDASSAPRLERVEVAGKSPDERRQRLRERLLARSREPFDLARGPLFRASLGRVSEEEHVLFVLTHHTVFDGLSMAVFLRELATLYEAYAAGQDSPLPELAVQYADYAAWQRARLSGAEGERELAWWKEQLAGELPVLDLPTDRKRPALQTYKGAVARHFLPRELVERLAAVGQREDATLFMTLLAAYQAFLGRLTAVEDVIVGTAVGSRNRTELEGLLGFFANTLALRADLSGDPTFRGLVSRVRETVLGALDHQETPFERLVDELAPERNLSTTPIFQTLFVLDEDLGYATPAGPLSIEYFDLEMHTARTELTLLCYQGRDGLVLWAEYNTDLFDAATIERFLRSFETLLQGVVADADRALSSLPLLPPEEGRRLLEAWNATRSGYPRQATIQQVFEEQVERTPEAVAAVFVGDDVSAPALTLTYRELNERANRLAHHLRGLGVGPDRLVGLCAERSLPMLVGILGILKAGGAYLPLDPGYPAERLRFMIEDARLDVLLVQQKFVEVLPPCAARRIVLDAPTPSFAGESASNPARRGGSSSLAYAMFTSGSTGRPKGVLVEHKSVLRLVMDPNFAHLGPDEVLLHFAPISFDASTLEVWGALLRGGRMVVYPPTQPSLEELGQVIREHGVTTAWLTAGLFSLMVDQRLEDLRGLRQLLAGGDVLPVPQVNRVIEQLPGVRLINGYGPTENTTFTCCHEISARGKVSGPVPIGRPISDTRVYVLDARRAPVPIGVWGELHAAGDGLARGYLDRPELTAERFVPDPFAGEAGARMYRTGDLVRWRPDGTLEFKGRRDDQVKVRGFRIELGEIETVLGARPQVRECSVLVREDVPGDKRIVAYVVPRAGAVLDASELRRELAGGLPDYMVPAHVVFLDELPLSPNGKVDRRRLPAPDRTGGDAAGFEAPRNEVERRIAEIWQEVLGLERVGVRDNFFQVGGNSLLSIQTVSRIRKAFGVELPLRELFQDPTVSGLATRVGAPSGDVSGRRYDAVFDTSLIPLQPRGWRTPLFLVSGAHAHEDDFLRFVGSILPHMGLDQPIYGFKARGLDGVQAPHACAEDMARDYIREMRAFQPDGPYLLAGNCVGGIVAYEMAQQLHHAGQEVALVALLDTTRPREDYQAFVDRHYRFWKLERFVGHWRKLQELSGGHRMRYLWEKLVKKARAFLPMSETQRRLNHVERVERQYSMILARYRAAPYPGKVSLIVNEALQAMVPDAGWRELCGDGLETHVVPGDHVTRLSMNAGQSAEILKDCIARATTETGSAAPLVRNAAG